MTTTIKPTYKSGDCVCMTCGIVYKRNPAISGVSHGYCPPCGQVKLAEVDAWIAKQQQVTK